MVEYSPAPIAGRRDELDTALLVKMLNQQCVLGKVANTSLDALDRCPRNTRVLLDLLLGQAKELSCDLQDFWRHHQHKDSLPCIHRRRKSMEINVDAEKQAPSIGCEMHLMES